MSPEHKEAIATSRNESVSVRRYLEAIAAPEVRRPRTSPAEATKRLSAITTALTKETSVLTKLELLQEQSDLTTALEAEGQVGDVTELEEQFVVAAKGFSERKKISYSTWRAIGVPADVLRRAGIARTRRA